MFKLVLVRHGESIWNKENKFTGWTDIDLTKKGINESLECAKILSREGYIFDIAFTSVLKRSIRTLLIILEKLDLMWIPTQKSWRLNERHYGALQGLNKKETVEKYGEKQVLLWRRSYDMRPPALKKNDSRNPLFDPKYKDLKKCEIPLSECLKDTAKRFLPYWENEIVPEIKKGKRVIIVAHGNSLRALLQHLDKISDEKIVNLNIPTGIPLVYELNEKMKPIKSYYLGDEKKIKKAMEKVKNQIRK